jgi:hypothetical protein
MPICMLIAGVSWLAPLTRKVFALYELPVIISGAVLFDPNPLRRKIYLYGGLAAVMGLLLSLFF